MREEDEAKQKEIEKKKSEKKAGKSEQREAFLKCKESCCCEEIICKATGLKECPVCKDVMKSQCTKAKCKVDGIKPLMVSCEFDVSKQIQRSSKKLPQRKRQLTYDLESGSDEELNFSEDDDNVDEELNLSENDDNVEEGGDVGGESDVENIDQDDTDDSESGGNDDATPMNFEEIHQNMWVKVIYEGQKFIGKVMEKVMAKEGDKKKQAFVKVKCLEKPFGIREPQDFEMGDGVYYKLSRVFKTDMKPEMTQIDKNGRKQRKWCWIYQSTHGVNHEDMKHCELS